MLVIGRVLQIDTMGRKWHPVDTSLHHVVTNADVDAVKWFKIISQWLHMSMWNDKKKSGEEEVTFRSRLGFIGAAQRSVFCPVVCLTSSLVDIQSPSSGQGWHQSWNGCRGFRIYTPDQSRVCLTFVDRESPAPLHPGKLCRPQHVCVFTFRMQQSVHTGHILMSQAFQST